MIKHRVINGAIMIGLLVGALFLPPLGVFLIIPVLAGLMLWEFYGLLASAGMPNFRILGTAAGVVLIVGTGLHYLYGYTAISASEAEGLLMALVVIAVLVRQCMEKNGEQALVQIGATLFGFLYIAFLFNFYTKLLLQWPSDDGRYLLFYMILVVKVTDMGAYFVGCGIGKHKLIPRISPAKTWEGCAGGVAAGLATSLLFWWLADGQIGPVSKSFAHAAILGMVLPVTGILGDLIESMLKRAAQVKDSGQWLKGMGGVLDVLDSLLLAGPVLYVFVLLFVNP